MMKRRKTKEKKGLVRFSELTKIPRVPSTRSPNSSHSFGATPPLGMSGSTLTLAAFFFFLGSISAVAISTAAATAASAISFFVGAFFFFHLSKEIWRNMRLREWDGVHKTETKTKRRREVKYTNSIDSFRSDVNETAVHGQRSRYVILSCKFPDGIAKPSIEDITSRTIMSREPTFPIPARPLPDLAKTDTAFAEGRGHYLFLPGDKTQRGILR